MRNNRSTGKHYEEIAAKYLEQSGYVIQKRNYRSPWGEIDLIARKDELLVFVEVKYRHTGSFGEPGEAVSLQKQRKISRAALWYYAGNGYEQSVPCRFDVIGVRGDDGVEHLENAFEFQMEGTSF